MQLAARCECELENRRAVAVVVHGVRGHVVCWAADDPIAEPRLPLKEGAVEVRARIELVEAREEGGAGEREQILRVSRFGDL